MASSDNPIDKIFNDVLNLGRKPESFSEKIEGLRRALYMPDDDYIDVFKKDKKLSSLITAEKASTPEQILDLFGRLKDRKILPESAFDVFRNASRNKSSIYFDEVNSSLFYKTEHDITTLPLKGRGGAVSFGGRDRKVNTLLRGNKVTPFIDEYYDYLAEADNVHIAASKFRESDLSKLLMEGVNLKGAYTPEESFWASRRSVLDMPSNPEFAKAFSNNRLYASTFSMLVKTGGRVVNPELQKLTGKIDYKRAFQTIKQFKTDYIDAVKNQLLDSGNPTSFVFTKPEFLGGEDKFLVSSPELSKRWGTRFEAHTLQKGLFQLAKLKTTDPKLVNRLAEEGIDATAPFMLAGENGKDMLSRMKLRVGVVDTTNDAVSRLLFQEGGALLTPSGAKLFAQNAPMGDLTFSSPSEDLIKSVERTFGINLGAGNVQSFSEHPANQLSSAHSLDRSRILKASGNERGLVKLLNTTDNRLAKVELTDSSLKLSFATPYKITPSSSEINITGRRYTARVMQDYHTLKGLIPDNTLGNIDVLMGADEFNKNIGTDAFLTNFAEKVRRRENAAEIFKNTFGLDAHISLDGKTKVIIPRVVDADTAYVQARNTLRKLKTGSKSDKLLAREIQEGNSLVTEGMLAKGIKGIRIFGLGGAARTDFMGDINMMNPVAISASKLKTMAAGSKHLGYSSHYEDPMVSLLMGSSEAWRSQSIGIRAGSGELFVSSKHIHSRYSRALLGKPGYIDPKSIVTIGKGGGFVLNGNRLKGLPTSIEAFGHSKGVSLDSLQGTILDQTGNKEGLLYLDLGENKSLNILGAEGSEKSYRYLPINLEAMRVKEGVHGKLVIGKNHPSYSMLESLITIDSNRNFSSNVIDDTLPSFQEGYFNLNKAIVGKEGLFQVSNSIIMPLGTRGRLAPQSGNYFDIASLDDARKLYTTRVSSSDLDDYLLRKSGTGKGVNAQIKQIKQSIKDKGYFYSMVSIDPMQRAEHANVMKVMVDKKIPRTSKIGQLNMEMHPFWYLLTERDTDRDAATIVPFTGLQNTKYSQSQLDSILEERWLKQQKLSEHFMWFYKHQLMAEVDPAKESAKRLSGLGKALVKAKDAVEYLSAYIGVSKSLGYSTVRASDSVMANLIAYGKRSAKSMGIDEKYVSGDMLDEILKPYASDKLRGEMAEKMWQNILQSPVQKGADSPLEVFSESLTEIGQKYKGKAFDHKAVIEETQQELVKLLSSSSKTRSFTDTEYLYKNFSEVKRTLDLMKADLERGAEYAIESGKAAKLALINAQAQVMAERIGPGAAIAASVPSYKGVNSIIQMTVGPETTPETIIKSGLEPAAGAGLTTGKGVGLPPRASTDLGANAAAEKAAVKAGESIAMEGAGEAADTLFSKASKYFNSSKGKTFALGAGVGAIAAAGIMSMTRNHEAPLPRQIDNRQPTDMAPNIFSTAPKIYGNNQSFAPRQRSSQPLSSMQPYRTSDFGGSSITIRDRSSPNNPYMIDRHIRDISNSDYVY